MTNLPNARPRSPPLSERNDGMTTLRCPCCNWPWYRMTPAVHSNLHEIRCRQCKRIVVYRVEWDQVIDLTTTPEGEAHLARGSVTRNGV